jgi:hypothetical protein
LSGAEKTAARCGPRKKRERRTRTVATKMATTYWVKVGLEAALRLAGMAPRITEACR